MSPKNLQIMIRRVNLNFERQDFQRANEVPFCNTRPWSSAGFRYCSTSRRRDRRAAAVVRIRDTAGLEPGYTALAKILKQRTTEQMAKPAG